MKLKKPWQVKLTKIDIFHLPDHHLLSKKDQCFFLGEYTASKGYVDSPTNAI